MIMMSVGGTSGCTSCRVSGVRCRLGRAAAPRRWLCVRSGSGGTSGTCRTTVSSAGRVVRWREGAVGEVGELAGSGHGVAFVGGQGVVGVVGNGERRGGVGEGVADDVVVAAGAQQDPDGGGVPVGVAQVLVDPGDVKAELAGVFGLGAADLELEDDEAGLGPVEEQQVDVEVVAVDLEVVLLAEEREAVAELEQEALQAPDEGVLEVAFGGPGR